jgi:hypothetical protein
MRRTWLAACSVFVGVAMIAGGCSGKSGSKSSDGDPGHPEPNDVFLEALDERGANPFTPSVAFAAVPDVTPPSGVRGPVRGSRPGLFGGTASKAACDTTSLVTALDADEENAQAWVDALNSDPTLQWSGGAKLAVDDIALYATELTPVVVRSDTRVANFGLLRGRAVAHEAVLQHGTAILVDTQGMPRVRCASGSPLIRPVESRKPKFRGTEWDAFDSDELVTVTPAIGVMDELRVVDVHTRKFIDIPVGSTCCDAAAATTTSTTEFEEDTTTTPRARTTTSATTTVHSTTTPPTTTTSITAPPMTEPETTSTSGP